jgi:predicted regulator of Ras-like GTPase activity (Roadblock/LC7/MglB family)
MSIRGGLHEMSLVDLIQVACLERTATRIEICNGARTVTVFCDGGNVVHAESDGDHGKPVLFEALSWSHGNFELVKGKSAPQRTILDGAARVLLEGMEWVDTRGREAPADVEPRVATTTVARATSAAHLLRALPGVSAAVVTGGDGRVRDGDADDAERLAALAVCLATAAETVGGTLDLGRWQHAACELDEGGRLLALPQGDGLVALLGDRSSPIDELCATARRTLS